MRGGHFRLLFQFPSFTALPLHCRKAASFSASSSASLTQLPACGCVSTVASAPAKGVLLS